MTDNQEQNNNIDFAEEFNKVRKSLVIVAAVLSIVFFGAAVVYVQFMAPTVEGLSGRIGELAYFRAREMQQAGEVEAAVDLYREALTRRFDDPRQRGWCLRHFGELLLNLERYDEAIPVLETCVQEFPSDFQAWRFLVNAQQQNGNFPAAIEAANTWFELTGEAGLKHNQGHAAYHLGMSLLSNDEPEAALLAFKKGYQLNPKTENPYRAAVILEQRGEYEEARVLYGAYLSQRSGLYLDEARARLQRLRDRVTSE
jgi:tetratricopeptide (TPR) repeat protein